MRLLLLPAALACALAATARPALTRQARAPAPPAACVDFNGHANHVWRRAHPATAAQPERSRLGEFVAEAAQARGAWLETLGQAPQGPMETALGTFWSAGIDEARLETNGGPALQAALAPLAPLRRPRDLAKTVAAFHELGLSPLVEFVRLEANAGGSRPLAAVPAPLGLVDPAFYTGTEPEIRTLLGKYRAYVETVLRASGLPETEISPASEAVLQIETQLAQALAGEATGTQNTDTLRAQDRRYIALGLADLLERLGTEPSSLVVVSPAYFATVSRLAADRDPQRMRWYLRFRVVHRLAPDLGTSFRNAHAGFFAQVLRGLPAGPTRTEHMDALLRRHLPGVADAAFNARFAPESRRQRATAVLEAVRNAAVDLVGRSDTEGAQRLASVRFDIAGTTVAAPDLQGLELLAGDHIGNLLRLSRWHEARVLADRPLAIDALPARLPALQWQAAPSTLAVSAAALAPPLLAEGGATPEPGDFGALGALAGHELAKAIDPGSRGAGLVPLVNSLQLAPGVRVDGARTLAMTRADLAGLEFAWSAFMSARPQADVPAKKAFFTGWATLWAKTQTNDALRAEAQSSPYAPAQIRVNTLLAQLPAFAETFGCRPGQAMRAAQPVTVWR